MNIDRQLAKAKTLKKKQDYFGAKKTLLEILEHFPENARAKSGIASLGGRASEASHPTDDQLNLLMSEYNNGNLANAKDIGLRLAKQFPNSVVLLNILGVTEKDLGDFEAAIQHLQQAVKQKTDYHQAFNNLGVALLAIGKKEQATHALEQAITLDPNISQYHGNLGNAKKSLGRLNEAIEHYDRSLSLNPRSFVTWTNRGSCLLKQNKNKEAQRAFETALSINPEHAEAHNNLGVALQEIGDTKSAIIAFQNGILFKADYPEAFNNLGNAVADTGNFDDAKLHLENALKLKPDYVVAHRNLSLLKTYNHEDAQIQQVRNLLANNRLSIGEKSQCLFTLAKMSEDLGDIPEAFRFYELANKSRKSEIGYNIKVDEELFKQIKRMSNRLAPFNFDEETNNKTTIPIFIMGMPRSGTTLVEQMISSHSMVNGAGELNFVSHFGGQISIGTRAANHHTIANFRTMYLTKLREISEDKQYVTDKLPQNFLHLALLVAALPEAKFINISRSPRATCWSNYKHYFASKDIGFCYDIEDTVRYFQLYNDLMAYWTSKFQGKIFQLKYEQLTANPNMWAKKIIEYLELAWEENCASPHKNQRSVRTASQRQVREKIYSKSREDWQKYQTCFTQKYASFQSLPETIYY